VSKKIYTKLSCYYSKTFTQHITKNIICEQQHKLRAIDRKVI